MSTRWMLIGAGLLVLVGLLATFAAVSFGLVPANADAKPSGLERWAARTSLKATIRREATVSPNPLPTTDENLNAGLKLYATNCMVCHGASDGKPSDVAQGLYQHAPQFGDHGVENDPEGATYWVVQHGIRLTGMPSFGVRLSDSELWQVVMFLKHMDKLPPAVNVAWKKEPSQSPKK